MIYLWFIQILFLLNVYKQMPDAVLETCGAHSPVCVCALKFTQNAVYPSLFLCFFTRHTNCDPTFYKFTPQSPNFLTQFTMEFVQIEVQGGDSFPIEVGLADTVLEIKQKIQNQRGVPVSEQTLIFNNVVLEDQSDVYSELAQEARLTLVITPNVEASKMKIKVVTQRGAKMNIHVNGLNTLRELREKLDTIRTFPLPRDGYFFIHKQQVMDEDHTFRWHLVNDGDIIEVFPGKVTDAPA